MNSPPNLIYFAIFAIFGSKENWKLKTSEVFVMDSSSNRVSNSNTIPLCGECHQHWRNSKELIQKIISATTTPAYIYSEELINRRIKCIKKQVMNTPEVKNNEIKIFFSLLSNSNPYILKSIRNSGIDGFVVTSQGEYYCATQAGAKNHEMILSFIGLTEDDLDIFDRNFRAVSDDEYPIIMVNSINQAKLITENTAKLTTEGIIKYPWLSKIKYGFRIKLNDDLLPNKINTDNFADYLGQSSRMGIPEENFETVFKLFKDKKIEKRIKGIYTYIGANITSKEENTYFSVIKRLFEVLAEYENEHQISFDFINIGGGFGIPYDHKGVREFDFKKLSSKLTALLSKTRSNKSVYIEPGAYIIAPSAVLVTKIIDKKDEKNNHFLVTDTSYSVFARPFIYKDKAKHKVIIIPGGAHTSKGTYFKKTSKIHIVGCSMAVSDFIRKNMNSQDFEYLDEDTNVDDILLIMDAGAYGYTMSSNYGGFVKPAEVLISKDGKIELIREREELNDLVKRVPLATKTIELSDKL
ncbi:MAG: hypothetical protein H7844_12665 [Nitrospirae bacterium YQR-1]